MGFLSVHSQDFFSLVRFAAELAWMTFRIFIVFDLKVSYDSTNSFKFLKAANDVSPNAFVVFFEVSLKVIECFDIDVALVTF
jgi:hypothetical protein